MKNLNPGDFIDPSILKEIEDSGFVKNYMEISGANPEGMNIFVDAYIHVEEADKN